MNVMKERVGLLSRVTIMQGVMLLTTVFISLCLVYTIGMMVYNVFFHPLRKYPGPKWWAASRVPFIYHSTNGRVHNEILKLHKKYGGIVRIGPKELSYTTKNAWKEIYGLRSNEMSKDLRGSGLLPTFAEAPAINTAPRKDHARMRRTVAHAFSEKALREQEDRMQYYVDLLISRLRDKCIEGPQDIVSWLNYTTFDIMGELTYSQPFGCLEEGRYHDWVKMIFQGIKQHPWVQALLWYNLTALRKWLTPHELVEAKSKADNNAISTVDERLAKKDNIDRKDFMSYILRHNDDRGMSDAEIKQTAIILMVAGSETTATFLSGALYLLLRNPRVYERLVKEIRDTFSTYESIGIVSTNELRYLPAVVAESFRCYPPAPNTHPRIVPEPGEFIEERWVPGDTTVGVSQWATNHDPENFYRPDDFLPERHLPDLHPLRDESQDVPAHLFEDDNKEVVQPFSVGPRNCLGKNLAYGELRSILAKLLWTFDLELSPQSDNDKWITTQQTFMLWEKPSLYVNITPRKEA
ncbi:uncharacterized protein Z518_04828 [Rhinocladiella mackenziei CBS 650.93]|uniref:Cytochrome P450 monooxygenase n=1 Tax=Rhinocladiella mackenziei CBS 650.93 TaxID=1442369 RepID=A0A0D2FWZ7_9EURO|nr:uncharacterized protein Z518_04828 [Rhinocladiella mackenziei CBS 650.93]KIX06852.1 hypothetical protein Z518_04828 [Rhinocladiella mackenziei CBS 650.93]